jgi:dTMP kinase
MHFYKINLLFIIKIIIEISKKIIKMNGNVKRGMLIVFEGVDRSGKSSQIEMLKNYFNEKRGLEVEVMQFPDRTTQIGQQINSLLKKQMSIPVRFSHLLFSVNRWELRENILTKLKAGVNLIIDRYAFSGVVYSIVNGANKSWAYQADQGLPRPDLVIQLDVDIEVIINRKGWGEEIYEREDFQRKIREEFTQFHKHFYWNLVNADRKKEEIHLNIVEIVERLENKYKNLTEMEANTSEANFYPYSVGEDLFTADYI